MNNDIMRDTASRLRRRKRLFRPPLAPPNLGGETQAPPRSALPLGSSKNLGGEEISEFDDALDGF